jgi:predicted DNA-binding protein (MmcQ/YjbR family)
MTIEDIRAICRKFPPVTEDIKWETHLCYCVDGKIFIITSPVVVPVTASLKASDEDFAALSEREGFMPAPCLARYKWIYIDNINSLTKNEWKKYLGTAYGLVAAKLPVKIKKQSGIK